MFTRTRAALLPVVAVLSLMLAAGCGGVDDEITEAEMDRGINAGYLRGVPATTSQQILADLDGRQLTGPVEILASSTGTLYKITYFTRTGSDDVATRTYSRDGTVMAMEGEVIGSE
jgi:hypothetical protein